jgi:hypothetical protein
MIMNYISNIARSEGDPKVIRSGPSSLSSVDRLAKGLGWFSIGLGAAELFAPQRITRALGMEGKEALVRAYGAREIASGVLTLSADKQAGLWSRLAGDGLDIATLTSGLSQYDPKKDNVTFALMMVAGVTLLDLVAAQGTTARHSARQGERRLYRDRSGFPKGVQAARGAAKDFIGGAQHRSAPMLEGSSTGQSSAA